MKYRLSEYGAGIDFLHDDGTVIEYTQLESAVSRANARIRSALGISRDALQLGDGVLKAAGVAGSLKLTNDIEIDVVPKFISQEESDWRATLYMLSTLSKYGNVLSDDRIQANSSYMDSLYDICGRILAQEYVKNARKPIRKYRKESFSDFSIDGDINFEVVFERSPEGTEQSRVLFDRLNAYNTTIVQAMKVVSPYVTDNKTRNILSNAINNLGDHVNTSVSKTRLNVPNRNREWLLAYNLAFDVMQGLGVSFDMGEKYAPGFIVNTWQLWEWLVTTGLRIGLGGKRVIPQKTINWGLKTVGSRKYEINVYPDVTILSDETPYYLVDAKYKNLTNMFTGEIDRADLYEAYAFCRACNVKKIFLAYPESASNEVVAGSVKPISTYSIEDIEVTCVMVAFGSIDDRGGLYLFGQNISKGINSLL